MKLLITREICKTLMFIVIWTLPFGLAYIFRNSIYLVFFVISLLVSTGIFSHYEGLVKFEKEEQDDKR